jgi:hypothetical protein
VVGLLKVDIVFSNRLMRNNSDDVRGAGCDLPLELVARVLVVVLSNIAEPFHLLRACSTPHGYYRYFTATGRLEMMRNMEQL